MSQDTTRTTQHAPRRRKRAKRHTQHHARGVHAGEHEPGGPGRRTHNTTHRACTPVNGSRGAHASLRTAAWCCVYGVLGLPAPVHRCARSACTVSSASRPLFTGVHALRVVLRLLGTHPSGWRGPGGPVARPAGGAGCSRVPPDGGVVLRVRRPGPPGSCSPVCTLCVYGVLGLPAPVHRCARFVCGGACTAPAPPAGRATGPPGPRHPEG